MHSTHSYYYSNTSALLLQLHSLYMQRGFSSFISYNVILYHTQERENFYSDILHHVPVLLDKNLNEYMNICTMWYVACCNNVEIHTTGF